MDRKNEPAHSASDLLEKMMFAEENTMERLEAFEKMLSDIKRQSEYEFEQMEKLKAAGKEKSATYRQFFGNRMLYKMILEKYKEYGLIK